jgi:exosortase/archaeosortase family protein
MVLFGGVLGLHAWRVKPPRRQLALWLAAGLGGLWLVNLARLHVLARVGIAQGGPMLQAVHANIGWALFAAFMAVFWALVLRRPNHGSHEAHEP